MFNMSVLKYNMFIQVLFSWFFRDDGTAEIGASTMGAKSLCVPFEQPDGNEKLKPEDKCIHPECSQSAGFFTLFGRSY